MAKSGKMLSFVLVLGLALRLVTVLSQDPATAFTSGGDSGWYLANGYVLVTGQQTGTIPVDLSNLPTAPVYLIFLGIVQAFFLPELAVQMIWVIQAIFGTATCYFAYRLANRLAGDDERVGLLVASLLALSPAFILEAGQIATESLYIFLVTGGLWLYVSAASDPSAYSKQKWLYLALVSVVFGLATLTRAVLILFPLGLMLHLLLVFGWRGGLKRGFLLLAVYCMVVSTWTIYNKVKYDRWVIAAQGFAAFVYIGATDWDDPSQVDENLLRDSGIEGELPSDVGQQQQLYSQAASNIIAADPLGWIARRGTELAGAYLQPHGTAFFPGQSLKDLTVDWLQNDRTPAGLLRLTTAEQFWPKLAIYVFHYTSLIAGLVGLWLARRNWRVALPLAGFILYTTLIHLLLDALPRYLFPLSIVWWLFAGVALLAVWDRLRRSHRPCLTPTQEQGALSKS